MTKQTSMMILGAGATVGLTICLIWNGAAHAQGEPGAVASQAAQTVNEAGSAVGAVEHGAASAPAVPGASMSGPGAAIGGAAAGAATSAMPSNGMGMGAVPAAPTMPSAPAFPNQ
jgi:hypothetical protein